MPSIKKKRIQCVSIDYATRWLINLFKRFTYSSLVGFASVVLLFPSPAGANQTIAGNAVLKEHNHVTFKAVSSPLNREHSDIDHSSIVLYSNDIPHADRSGIPHRSEKKLKTLQTIAEIIVNLTTAISLSMSHGDGILHQKYNAPESPHHHYHVPHHHHHLPRHTEPYFHA